MNTATAIMPSRTRHARQEFIKALQETFCVCSSKVGKLYTDFELCEVRANQPTYVAVPDSFNRNPGLGGVTTDTIDDLPVYVIDGRLVGLKGLAIGFKLEGQIHTLPLHDGIEILQAKYADQGGFIPVILTQHLKLSHERMAVRMSRLVVDRVEGLNSFQRVRYTQTVLTKLLRQMNTLTAKAA